MQPDNSNLDGRRLQLLIDAVVDYAIYMIDPEGRVLSWNSGGAAQRLLSRRGYRRHFSEFYTPEDRSVQKPVSQAELASRVRELLDKAQS